MADWDPKTFPESRPSGVLGAKRGFSIEKFIGITVALAVSAGAGVAVWTVLDDDDDEPNDGAASAEAGTTEGPEEAPVKFDVAPEPPAADVPADTPKMDAGGPVKLDVPDPWYDDPSDAPSDAPGPEVETPDWE